MTTSNLSSAKPPSNPEDYLIKALIVGPSKGGKTTSALTLPGKKLLIDIHSKRSQAAVGFDNVDVILFKPESKPSAKPWDALEALVEEIWEAINSDSFHYSAIIWDDLSGMKRLCMDSCLSIMAAGGKRLATAPGGGPSQAHYGPHIHKTDRLINQIIPMPVHTVFTGHVYTFEDDLTNKLESWPNVYGRGLRSEIGSWFDETYYAYEEDLNGNLNKLVNSLKSKTYKAKLVRRKYIPKGDGKRPLGIYCVKIMFMRLFLQYSFVYHYLLHNNFQAL